MRLPVTDCNVDPSLYEPAGQDNSAVSGSIVAAFPIALSFPIIE
jgi:hypothetical protein